MSLLLIQLTSPYSEPSQIFPDLKSIEYYGKYEPKFTGNVDTIKGVKHSMLCILTLLTQNIKACNALNAMYINTVNTNKNKDNTLD